MSKEPGQLAFEIAQSENDYGLAEEWPRIRADAKAYWAMLESAIRADERERCAMVADELALQACEESVIQAGRRAYPAANHWSAHRDGCEEVAAAIRAKGAEHG